MKQSILSLAGPSASTSFSLIYSVATWMSYLLYERLYEAQNIPVLAQSFCEPLLLTR